MKKILIRAPRDPKSIIASFPFFHGLWSEFPDGDFNIVIDQGLEKFYSFLPFPIKFLSIRKENWILPEIHRFAKNLTSINYIDLYFDLENTFKSGYLGFALRCSERVGFENGLKKFFYNKKMSWREEAPSENFYLRYIEDYSGKLLKEIEVSGKTSLTEGSNPLVTNGLFGNDVNPTYFIVLLEDLGIKESDLARVNRDGSEREEELNETEKMWKEFFCSFEGQRFIFWSSRLDLELNEYIKSLGGGNEYFHQRGNDFSKLVPLIRHSKAVITDSKVDSYLSAYGEVPTFAFLEEKDEKYKLKYFKKTPCIVSLKDCLPTKVDLTFSQKEINSVSQAVDLVHEILHL